MFGFRVLVSFSSQYSILFTGGKKGGKTPGGQSDCFGLFPQPSTAMPRKVRQTFHSFKPPGVLVFF